MIMTVSLRGGDSVNALAALYAAEQTDVQNILGHALTLISILVSYSVVIGAAWATSPDTVPHYLIPVSIPVFAILEQKLLDQIPSMKRPTRLWGGNTERPTGN
jgi:hypothetical protein